MVERTMSKTTKFFFWFSVIILAFLPGGIFISVFLLALYYIGPMFLANKYTIQFEVKDESSNQENITMNQYDSDTLEEMR
jgi:hypothetical protein